MKYQILYQTPILKSYLNFRALGSLPHEILTFKLCLFNRIWFASERNSDVCISDKLHWSVRQEEPGRWVWKIWSDESYLAEKK